MLLYLLNKYRNFLLNWKMSIHIIVSAVPYLTFLIPPKYSNVYYYYKTRQWNWRKMLREYDDNVPTSTFLRISDPLRDVNRWMGGYSQVCPTTSWRIFFFFYFFLTLVLYSNGHKRIHTWILNYGVIDSSKNVFQPFFNKTSCTLF